ncbi:MAG: class I SAM-dependent methyltransferase [Candidatus Methylomirabilales bacterium]
MPLEPQGLYLPEQQAPLTAPVFRALLQRGVPFALKVDYRGLPPPLEELDLLRLRPTAAAGLPPGTLVLRCTADGFEFVRLPTGRAGRGPVARVVEVERAGARIRLDAPRWRLAGLLSVSLPGFAAALDRWRRVQAILAKLTQPLPYPVNLGSPEALIEGVLRKYAEPGEVARQVEMARAGLEDWEQELFVRVFPPAARLLVVGCGVGREVLGLARRGFRVVGADPVPACIAAARVEAGAAGLDAAFVIRAAHELDGPAGSFDGILCSSAVYEQTPTARRRVALLQAFGRLLAPGGVLVLCAGWNPTRGRRDALVDFLRHVARRLRGDRFTTEPGDRLIGHLSLASDPSRPCFYHVFQGPAEIEREIAAAGWTGHLHPSGAWVLRTPA